MTTVRATLRRRVSAAIAGVVVASVALSGCLYAAIPPLDRPANGAPGTPPNAPADTAGVAANLLPFYGQELEWENCDNGMMCTEVTAPLDWENPGDGSISIAVIRHPATSGTSLGSLLINPGGPGGSGYDFVKDSLAFVVTPELSDAYDVIGFDPRGVGRSSAVQCFEPEEMDDYLYTLTDGARGSDQWTDELNEAYKRFADACQANSDGILEFITTVNSARDMDLIRAVLGDDQLDYLGYSYGTFLGATYAELYPDKAGRLVLDGAIDPSTSGFEVSSTQALGFESALRAYMQGCLDGADCPFSGSVDNAMSDLAALLATADRAPFDASDGREMGADSLLTGIIAALYSEQSWGYLNQAFTEILQGSPDIMFTLADSYNARNADGTYADNSTEAFRAYNCMDYPEENDPAAEAEADAKIAAEAPTVAPYWNGPDPCASWPFPPSGARGEINAAGAGPILVVGTTNDPATPYEWSQALAEQLEEGVLITRVGEGHTGYNKGNVCVDNAVDAFFLEDVVPEDGLRCD